MRLIHVMREVLIMKVGGFLIHRIPGGVPERQLRAPEFTTRSHMRLTGALYESSD